MYTLYVIQDISSHVDLILYVISLDDALVIPYMAEGHLSANQHYIKQSIKH